MTGVGARLGQINRALGEAKLSFREKIGDRQAHAESAPLVREGLENLESIRYNLKNIYKKGLRECQLRAPVLEANAVFTQSLADYGLVLKDKNSDIGELLTQMSELHRAMAQLNSQLTQDIQEKFSGKIKIFVKGGLRKARYTRARYDKARISHEAAENKVKLLKRSSSGEQKVQKAVEEEAEAKLLFEEVQSDTLTMLNDVQDQSDIELIERVCDNYDAYKEFFARGNELLGKLSPTIEKYRSSAKTLREEFTRQAQHRGEQYFGVPIEDLVKRENRDPATHLPRVIEQLLWQLNTTGVSVEGIFRISANLTHMQELKKLILCEAPINWPAEDPHVLAGLVKSFLRELPEPLMLFSLYNKWVDVVRETDPDNSEEIVPKLQPLIASLPPTNRNMLKHLAVVMYNIAKNSEENKMTSMNLSTCLGPNTLVSETPLSGVQAMEHSQYVPLALRCVIDNVEELFPGALQECFATPPEAKAPPPQHPEGNPVSSQSPQPDSTVTPATPTTPPMTPSTPATDRIEQVQFGFIKRRPMEPSGHTFTTTRERGLNTSASSTTTSSPTTPPTKL